MDKNSITVHVWVGAQLIIMDGFTSSDTVSVVKERILKKATELDLPPLLQEIRELKTSQRQVLEDNDTLASAFNSASDMSTTITMYYTILNPIDGNPEILKDLVSLNGELSYPDIPIVAVTDLDPPHLNLMTFLDMPLDTVIDTHGWDLSVDYGSLFFKDEEVYAADIDTVEIKWLGLRPTDCESLFFDDAPRSPLPCFGEVIRTLKVNPYLRMKEQWLAALHWLEEFGSSVSFHPRGDCHVYLVCYTCVYGQGRSQGGSEGSTDPAVRPELQGKEVRGGSDRGDSWEKPYVKPDGAVSGGITNRKWADRLLADFQFLPSTSDALDAATSGPLPPLPSLPERHIVSGALSVLQEAGETELVLQIVESLLKERLPKSFKQDIALPMALAYVDLSRDAMALLPPDFIRGCEVLEMALKLLQKQENITEKIKDATVKVMWAGAAVGVLTLVGFKYVEKYILDILDGPSCIFSLPPPLRTDI
ncbi:Protein ACCUMULATION AND REPLICATION OF CHLOROPLASTS 6 [Orobanche gracilis]